VIVAERNVVGVIPGRGTKEHPEAADEIIVLSAHFDHMGVGGAGKDAEDRIMNGADDDASGVAMVMELAEALASGEAPVRTVVILLAAAEEVGMLGTHWFVDHCPVDLGKVVCNLNFEMLGRPDELVGGPGKLWFTGWDRTNLGPLIAASGVEIVADPRPDQRFFMRSDNIVFVQAGIVGQTLSSYNMHTDYHRVTDELETIDFDHMLAAGQACLTAVRAVVDGDLTPAWEEGEPKLGR
jgi:Zn-dependent M28 family amino/carboxypeptidase